MLDDPSFASRCVLTLVFVVGSAIIGQNALGLLLALLMRGRHRVARPSVARSWSAPG